ncbi:hypothetical protein [Lactobacillus xylocopicola]|uniref:Uncharacterized protein n=1 Tax=Lactobacillus xylocopicola TaxID=2976676 RepID=A0ABN6SJ39_9LACO|nr:hypothetical protein [Lactobacillus xylocopicola]BDR60345.1 hypothetical protein KIM322_06060 [Lactobacillus xylocopicola]
MKTVKKNKRNKKATKTGASGAGAVGAAAPALALATGSGFAPVVLTVGGTILVGLVALKAGSAAYRTAAQYFSKNSGRYKENKKIKEHRTHQSKHNRNKHQRGRRRVDKLEKKKLRESWKNNK